MMWGKSPERRVVMPAGAFEFLKNDIRQKLLVLLAGAAGAAGGVPPLGPELLVLLGGGVPPLGLLLLGGVYPPMCCYVGGCTPPG